MQEPEQPELDAWLLNTHDIRLHKHTKTRVLQQEGAIDGGELGLVHRVLLGLMEP